MPPPQKSPSYAANILWSWLGVAVLLLSGIVFTRILILSLGTARFGIWTLATSMVEYVWMIDLGFRPATVKFSAQYRALQRWDDLNRVINTALAYSVAAGLLVLLVSWFGAETLSSLYSTRDPDFSFLIRCVGMSWAAGLAFNIFAATTEGFQRFDLSNRSSIITTLLRGCLSVAAVKLGYGLRGMGWVMLGSQLTGYGLMFLFCRQVYPQLRLSPTLVNWAVARDILAYARQIVPGILGSRFAQGSMPSIIAVFKPTQYVTFFTQTQRMMDYAADAISRVGLVTAPRVAEWQAQGRRQEIITLTRTANRYCVTLWGLWACFLWVFGYELCRVWIDEEFARNVSALLPFFLIAYTLFMGQFVSAAVLMGIARYQRYSFTLLVEALVSVAAMAVLLPLWGLPVAVAGTCTILITARWFILSRLFAQEFQISQLAYLRDVFTKPALLILVSGALLSLLRLWRPGHWTFWELLAAGLAFAAVYGAAAFWVVVEPRHQVWAKSKIPSRFF